MKQRVLLLVACAALALGGCAGQSTSGRVDANFRGAGAPDRGWGYLDKSASTREIGVDQSRNVCHKVAATGATFGSSAGRVAWIDEAGALTETDLHSAPVAEPGQLPEPRSLNDRCFDDSD